MISEIVGARAPIFSARLSGAGGLGVLRRMDCLWEGEEARMRRVPWEVWWRETRFEMSLWRERPPERMTMPPAGSSRRSVMMCS